MKKASIILAENLYLPSQINIDPKKGKMSYTLAQLFNLLIPEK